MSDELNTVLNDDHRESSDDFNLPGTPLRWYVRGTAAGMLLGADVHDVERISGRERHHRRLHTAAVRGQEMAVEGDVFKPHSSKSSLPRRRARGGQAAGGPAERRRSKGQVGQRCGV